jgi:hypothetical protein
MPKITITIPAEIKQIIMKELKGNFKVVSDKAVVAAFEMWLEGSFHDTDRFRDELRTDLFDDGEVERLIKKKLVKGPKW